MKCDFCKKEQPDVIDGIASFRGSIASCPDCYPEAYYKELKAQKEATEKKAYYRKLLKDEFGI